MKVFALIGVAACVVIVAVFVMLLIDEVKEFLRKARISYIQKHRFDKPPTAKCYCIDCKYHGESGRCLHFDGWNTYDAWFCWAADPRRTGEGERDEI